ncbi:MAG: UDP-2,3-diacylglucosamine diphosphatase [Bacteroidales bacterium]|nr:UDP-2,3-diacylglucosamine diphosphatase [Bacteroidales bacterium]
MKKLFTNPITINGIVYLVSDFHFGSPDAESSKHREERVIAWLEQISKDATHLFLLGDVFDFWFEYKDVVPRGYFNFFAQLDKLRRKKVEIYYFTGNHDMWVQDYFTAELGIQVFRTQQAFLINGNKCLIAHGDGLGPKDHGYKFIKRVFAFRPNIKLYGALHPRIAFGLARFFSRKSRAMTSAAEVKYRGDEKEMLVQYALSVLQQEHIDYFIYGHRHLPIEKQLNENSRYLNTGDWLMCETYVRLEEKAELFGIKN